MILNGSRAHSMSIILATPEELMAKFILVNLASATMRCNCRITFISIEHVCLYRKAAYFLPSSNYMHISQYYSCHPDRC